MKIKNNLGEIIKKKGISLTKLSEGTGISFQQLSAIKHNKPKKIAYSTMAKLAIYLKCSFNDLFVLVDNG